MAAKILVVDDEPDVEGMVKLKMRRQIRNGEYDFKFARNGVEALEIIKDDPEINIVLSDINMPEMDGLTLLLKLNDLKPNTRSIVISAYGDMSNIRAAMNRGAYDFLVKPIDFEDLELTLHKTIQSIKDYQSSLGNVINTSEGERTASIEEAIVYATSQMIITTDETGRIFSANPGALTQTGYNFDELDGKDISMIFGNDLLKVGSLIKIDYDVEREIRTEADCYRKNGSHFVTELSILNVKFGETNMLAFLAKNINYNTGIPGNPESYRIELEQEINAATNELNTRKKQLETTLAQLKEMQIAQSILGKNEISQDRIHAVAFEIENINKKLNSTLLEALSYNRYAAEIINSMAAKPQDKSQDFDQIIELINNSNQKLNQTLESSEKIRRIIQAYKFSSEK